MRESLSDVDSCLMVTMSGTSVDPRLRRWLDSGLGSVILFGDNIVDVDQVGALLAELRSSAPHLLVAIDEEGGDVTRLERRDGSSMPGNLALGELDDLAVTERVAGAIGDLLAGAGIDLDLAPVADVNSNPQNPVIGSRSFGADPALVGRHVAAFVRGLQSRGVAACAKHFPGHGAAAADSHYELPIVDSPADVLSTVDVAPFRAAIAAGARCVMTSHVVYPAWDRAMPATLSRRILTDLLRTELGFGGVLITDALHMAAIREGVGSVEGAVRALAAGADLVCVDLALDEQLAVRDSVVAAIESGRLPAERVAEAAGRVRALQSWTHPTAAGAWDPEVGHAAARAAIARRQLPPGVPLHRAPYVVDAGVRVRPGVGVTSAGLLDVMTSIDPRVRGMPLTAAPDDVDAVLAAAGDAPLVVAVRDAHRRAWQGELVAAALARRRDAVVVGTGTADDARLAPGRYIAAFGCGKANLLAVAQLLLGRAREHAA